MTETKHTPGPFTISTEKGVNGRTVIVSGAELVATLSNFSNATGERMPKMANAALLCAAPDLLYACEVLAALIDALGEKVNWGASFLDADTARLLNEAPLVARDAIAKATGGIE